MVTSGHLSSRNITGTRPNFLASQVGLEQKTRQITKSSATEDTEGRFIVKGGSLYKNAGDEPEGIVFEDVDVTRGDMPGSVILKGSVLIERLDAAVFTAEVQTALTAKGLYFEHQPETTRV
ncbi:MAG: hypothetical protein LBU81_00900 [Methanosarcinales archaeon]|nr:hypothetical protein [Methanosarcinales archaeon]